MRAVNGVIGSKRRTSSTACGASWVSLHHGGGVGIGYSIHAGMVVVADGTESGDRRLKRVLTADQAQNRWYFKGGNGMHCHPCQGLNPSGTSAMGRSS